MGFLRNRLSRRFPKLGLISDLALVGGVATRMVQRRNGSASRSASVTELALAGGAAMRLLQRLVRRRRARRSIDG